MEINTIKYRKKHGCEPTGQRNWKFTLSRKNINLHYYCAVMDYEKAINHIQGLAKRYEAQEITLEP